MEELIVILGLCLSHQDLRTFKLSVMSHHWWMNSLH